MLLFFAFFAFVGYVAAFGVGSVPTSGSVASAVAGSRVGIWSKFFIGNIVLLKLLKLFSLALDKKDFYSNVFAPFLKLFNSMAKLLRLLSDFYIDKCPSCISLKKQ